MKPTHLPPTTLLHELFEYKEGNLHWKVSSNSRVKMGDVAGTPDSKGYIKIKFDGQLYPAHRLIFAIVTGTDPSDKFIDHVDGNPSNNRIENLRLATNAENCRHRKGQQANNTSGYRGVTWNTRRNKWLARVMLNGRQLSGGHFTDIADANAKAIAMRLQHFGEFQGKNNAVL